MGKELRYAQPGGSLLRFYDQGGTFRPDNLPDESGDSDRGIRGDDSEYEGPMMIDRLPYFEDGIEYKYPITIAGELDDK